MAGAARVARPSAKRYHVLRSIRLRHSFVFHLGMIRLLVSIQRQHQEHHQAVPSLSAENGNEGRNDGKAVQHCRLDMDIFAVRFFANVYRGKAGLKQDARRATSLPAPSICNSEKTRSSEAEQIKERSV